MKAIIENTKYISVFNTRFGEFHSHKIWYNNKEAFYNSKSKEQTKFVKGKEAEFTEELKEGKNGKYLQIKPLQKFNGGSNYGRQLQKEQSRYSGFAMSYAKDLVIAGKIDFDQMLPSCEKIFNYMVQLDKKIQS
jgi:hypothetical protein